jgi:hypothetical protein
MSVVLTVIVILALMLVAGGVRQVQQYQRGVVRASGGCSRRYASRACN